jgi:hypothetical protein
MCTRGAESSVRGLASASCGRGCGPLKDERAGSCKEALFVEGDCVVLSERHTSKPALSAEFKPIYEELSSNADKISKEMIDCQGSPVDFGGYYHPDWEKLSLAMRPSATFNSILAKL